MACFHPAALFLCSIDSIINGTNEKAKQGLRKYVDFLKDIIKKIGDFLTGKSGKAKAEGQTELAEITRLRDMFETAVAKAVENRKAIQARTAETKSSNNIEIKTKEGYNDNISHSLKTEQYTENEYRKFGWARANNILNEGQNADYRSKFADAKAGRAKFNKSKHGEYIIPVSDIYNSSLEGIDNVLVFAKGTIANPVITSVIEIYEYDETNLDKVRRNICELERRGIQQKAEGIIRRYYANDSELMHYREYLESSRNYNGERLGAGDSRETSGYNVITDYSLKGTNNISAKDHKELTEIIGYLKGEFEITKFAKADQKKLAKMTKDILKEYNSRAGYDETFKAIDELYQYMANGEEGHPPVWDEVYGRAYKAAQEIVKNALVVDDYAYWEYRFVIICALHA